MNKYDEVRLPNGGSIRFKKKVKKKDAWHGKTPVGTAVWLSLIVERLHDR